MFQRQFLPVDTLHAKAVHSVAILSVCLSVSCTCVLCIALKWLNGLSSFLEWRL